MTRYDSDCSPRMHAPIEMIDRRADYGQELMMSLEKARKAALEKNKKAADQKEAEEESVAQRVKKSLMNAEKVEPQRQGNGAGKKSIVFSTITEFTRGINMDNSLGVSGASTSMWSPGLDRKREGKTKAKRNKIKQDSWSLEPLLMVMRNIYSLLQVLMKVLLVQPPLKPLKPWTIVKTPMKMEMEMEMSIWARLKLKAMKMKVAACSPMRETARKMQFSTIKSWARAWQGL